MSGDHIHHDHADHSQMNHHNHADHSNMNHDHEQPNNVLANITNLINSTIAPLLTQQVDESSHLDQHNHHTDHINHMDQNNPMGQSRHQEHSAHQNHGSMDHMMSMAFHGGYNETILFSWWKIDSISGLIYSMLLIFVAAALYEGLKYFREYLFWKTYNSLQYRAVSMPEKNSIPEGNERVVHMVGEVVHKQPPTMFSKMHIFQTFLHVVQVTLSFLLMLIFMTYNTWLCIAVASGAATGFFLFGWKKSVAVDVTEHCH